MSVLTGLMIGSLATLWPWKESYDTKGVSPNLGINEVFENFEICIDNIIFQSRKGYYGLYS